MGTVTVVAPQAAAPVGVKRPALALALSFIWPGLGQLYNGQRLKAGVLAGLYVLSWLLLPHGIGLLTTPILWVAAMVDAYRTARRTRPAIPTAATAAAPPALVSGPGHPLSVDPVAPLMPHVASKRHHYYRAVLGIGLLAFAGLTAATAATGNPLAITLVVVVGSFLVPTVYVEYLDELDLFGGLPRRTLLLVAGVTAVIALPSAIVLEGLFHADAGRLLPSFGVGFIEEAVKLLFVLWLLRSMRFRFTMDGVIVGAAAGMGFAAFESAGYALSALLQGGIDSLLINEWLRAALSPFGHGTWTAAICAVLWSQRFSGRGWLSWRVVLAYLGSSALHGLWDFAALPGVYQVGWMLAVGIVSVLVLRYHVRHALQQEQLAESAQSAPPTAPVAAPGAAAPAS